MHLTCMNIPSRDGFAAGFGGARHRPQQPIIVLSHRRRAKGDVMPGREVVRVPLVSDEFWGGHAICAESSGLAFFFPGVVSPACAMAVGD